jgi:predicted TIM-barrel enzyme
MRGLPTLLAFLPYADAYAHTRSITAEILPAVRDTPCIAGISAHDPSLNLEKFMDEMLELGFSGFTNEPFVGIYGHAFATQLESAGIGFPREVAMIELAHRKKTFAVAWVFSPEEAKAMAEAGADVVGAHVGVTAGGLTGAKDTINISEAVRAIQAMCEGPKRQTRMSSS